MLNESEREKLDDLRRMLGPEAGNLALALEQLTDAMAMINLHGVYCRAEKRSSGGGSAARAPTDIAEALQTVEKAKQLLRETLSRLSGGPAAGPTPAGPPA